ncbi:MAG: type III pantothenate kinase [Firmicutes bacterium]|nr:type III pantothenate kinase [Bacillota bacterium]
MILAVDIGNTNITLGVYEGNKLCFTSRLATDVRRTADQYAIELRDILHLNSMSSKDIDGAVIGSVVPSVGAAFNRAVGKLFGVQAVVIGPGVRSGLNIRIDNPAQLGADLVAGAVAAAAKYPKPCIVFDLGTATTVSVIDADGTMIGGAIAAGPVTSLEALAAHTAQLPYIDLTAPKNVIGSNTIDCMRSGIIIGAAAMLDGMAARIEGELGQRATLVATGGLAERVVANCEREVIIDDDLLLEGLLIVYEKNKR